ncbi:MAG TPA: Ig-like domain-containing protein, partial [Gemmatimonadaceae bacterium]|nr:Ig-like domain-containing protein [Gemmatimonadaceae bacterium]
TGKPPFEGAPMSVLISHIQDEVPLVRTVRPDCPPELEAAIARMLAKNPEDRFPSVGEAMQAAGAAELPDFSAERKKFGDAAMRLSVQANATVLDLKSIPPSIEVGDRISIEATAKTVMGDPVTAGSVEFSLAESTVASIDRDKGTLIALEPGKATLVVRSGGVEQTVQVNIVPPKVATLQLGGPSGVIRIGDRTQLTASARSKNGVPVETIPKWSIDNPALATISAEGVLQARGAGRTLVRAQVDNVTSEFWLEVAAPVVSEVRITGARGPLSVGDRRQLTAVVLDTADNVLADRIVQWTSSDRSIATVSSSGLVSATATGDVTITATSDTKSAQFAVTIEALRAAHIELQPAPASITVGDKVRLRAVARDSHGNAIDRDVAWISDDPAIATVANDGTVTAVHVGGVRVVATLDGVTAATELNISPRVTTAPPATASAGPQVSVREAATVIDAPAIKRPEPPAAPPSSVPVTPVSAQKPVVPPPPPTPVRPAAPVQKGGSGKLIGAGIGGLVLVAAAVFVITRGDKGNGQRATGQGASAAAPATSGGGAPNPPANATVPPKAAPPDAGKSVATPAKTAPPPVSKSPSNPSSSSGASNAQPVVTPPKRSLAISSPSTSLTAGDSVALRAAFSDGSPVTGLRWTSHDPSRANVSASGVVHAVSAGTVEIVATAGAQSDTVRLDVRAPAAAPAPVTKPPVTVTPPPDNPPPTSTRGTEPAVSPERAATERIVKQIVGEYAKALNAKKLNDALRYYPKMPKDMQNGWKALFDGSKDLQVVYNVEGTTPSGDGATAHVTGQQTFTNPSTKKKCELPVSLEMTLGQPGNTWQIIGIKQIGATPAC